MSLRRFVCVVAVLLAGIAWAADAPTLLRAASTSVTSADTSGGAAQAATAQKRGPDVIFVPTPTEVVEAMLKAAKVTKNDVVYDLGCGDGRIVITAAKEYGARGIGIDIDPQRISEARANAEKAGVTDRVKFLEQDLFETDFHEATVVALYLLPSLNLKLRPKLWKELKPGTRIVSHAFDMGDWKPEQEIDVDGRTVYLWTVPKQ
jgi:SAM-dependent methyltransferase